MARGGFEPSRCKFLGSSPRLEGAPASGLPEVAVAGRSNVGKSSLINFLLGRKGLARTSSTPGRTQLLNFFEVDGRLTVVDLPGYGYAKAPREAVRRWIEGLEGFVRKRDALKGVVLLLDVRREPSPEDRAFAALVRGSGLSLLGIVTKADKVSRTQCARSVAAIREDLSLAPEDLVVTSSKDGVGRAEAWRCIFRMLEEDETPPEAQPASRARVIAIDGPSGAGKSTVARRLAARLGWNHIDTGAMYRSIGLKADRTGVAVDDDSALERLCRQTRLELHRGPEGATRIFLDGEDVSDAIREHRVSDLASRVSARLPVRSAMSRFQRELGLASPSVLEGRDIGTVVFPDAFLKVYLTASAEERANRRAEELRARGVDVDRARLLHDILERDENDSSREYAPLQAAADAVVVDTTGVGIDDVVARLASLAEERLGG